MTKLQYEAVALIKKLINSTGDIAQTATLVITNRDIFLAQAGQQVGISFKQQKRQFYAVRFSVGWQLLANLPDGTPLKLKFRNGRYILQGGGLSLIESHARTNIGTWFMRHQETLIWKYIRTEYMTKTVSLSIAQQKQIAAWMEALPEKNMILEFDAQQQCIRCRTASGMQLEIRTSVQCDRKYRVPRKWFLLLLSMKCKHWQVDQWSISAYKGRMDVNIQ